MDFDLSGTVYGTEEPEECSIRFTGSELRYLFKVNTLKGNLSLTSENHSFESKVSGPLIAIPDGDPNEYINFVAFSGYDEVQNQYVACTIYFTDDRKTYVVKCDNKFYCVSLAADANTEELFHQMIEFAN